VGVFLAPARRKATGGSFLHTREGVPYALHQTFMIETFSPHAWGVPLGPLFSQQDTSFSPHAWGCSGALRIALEDFIVFPTRVRAFYSPSRSSCLRERSPPHAWGRSIPLRVLRAFASVLPHMREVFYSPSRSSRLRERSPPHAWGVLLPFAFFAPSRAFSPTRVGCSIPLRVLPAFASVLPYAWGVPLRGARRVSRG